MKKLRIFNLLVIGLLLSASVMAQPVTFQWAKAMGGSANDRGFSIVTDASGNVYTAGSFEGTVDFDPSSTGTVNLTAIGQVDIFISKLDAAGNFMWAKSMGGPLNDQADAIALDASGNVYTTGLFQGTSDFNPGAGTFTLATGAGSDDVFISKLDNSGNFVWAKHFGGGASIPAQGRAIAVDVSGNVLTTGVFAGTVDFDPNAGTVPLTSASGSYVDIFISKLDALGNYVWAKRIGAGDDDQAFSLALDNSGNVYTTGFFSFTVDFDPGAGNFPLTALPGRNTFISKLDAAGNFGWAKQLSGADANEGRSIAIDPSGNVLTTGLFVNTVDFDPGPATSFSTSVSVPDDIYISKLDASGNFVWAKSIGSTGYDRGNAITADVLGNVYVTGYFVNTADFDPGTGIDNKTSAGAQDGFILKLNSAGNYVWSKIIGGPLDEYPHSIAVDAFASVHTTGEFQGTCDFDPDPTVSNLIANAIDIYIHKMSQCTVPTIITNASSPLFCKGNSTTLTASGATTYTWSTNAGSSTTASVIVTPTLSSTYTVTGANGSLCSNTETISVTVVVPPTPTICMVTVDSIGKNNVILWDKDQYAGADSFFVYRETASTIFQIVGKAKRSVIPFGEFRDTVRSKYAANGDPNVAAWKYKIEIKDTCGNVSAKSPFHETICVQHSGANFTWNQHYRIEGQIVPPPDFKNYQFRRDNNATGNWVDLIPITGISYTDPQYAMYSTTADWRVEVEWFTTQCPSTYFKTTGAIKRAKSNVSNNKLIGIKENALEGKIKVFPNPAKESIAVDASFLNENYSVTIQNSLGQTVLVAPKNFGMSSVNISKLASGFYNVVITTETGSLNKKLIIE